MRAPEWNLIQARPSAASAGSQNRVSKSSRASATAAIAGFSGGGGTSAASIATTSPGRAIASITARNTTFPSRAGSRNPGAMSNDAGAVIRSIVIPRPSPR
jgi:hypothetical protein